MTTSLDLKQAQPLLGVFQDSSWPTLVRSRTSLPPLLLPQRSAPTPPLCWVSTSIAGGSSGGVTHISILSFQSPLSPGPSQAWFCACPMIFRVGWESFPQCHRRARPHHALASLTPHDKTVIPFLAFWSRDNEPGFSKRHLELKSLWDFLTPFKKRMYCVLQGSRLPDLKTDTNFGGFCPNLLSITVINIMTKKQLGEEKVDLAYMSQSGHEEGGLAYTSQSVHGGGKPGRSWSRDRRGTLLPGLFFIAHSTCLFFIQPRTTNPGVAPPTVGCTRPHV